MVDPARAATDTSIPTARGGWRPDIQGLRAVAVLMVVVFHAGLPLPGGFVGVDVFFVISGFVITGMVMREHRSTGTVSLTRFYARRFKRLVPALAVMVVPVMVLSVFFVSVYGDQEDGALTAAGAMLFAANLVIAQRSGGYFATAAEANPLLNTWSLGVEEQFYLLFPVVLLLGLYLSTRTGRPRLVTVVVAVIGSLSLLLALGSWAWNGNRGVLGALTGFYGPLGRAWEFAVGAIIALGSARLAGVPVAVARLLAAIGAAALIAAGLLLGESARFPGPWTLLPVLGTAALITAGPATPWLTKGLSLPVLVLVGDMSYSLYLWHWPLIVLTRNVWPASVWAPLVAAAAAVLPAWASYRFVERRFRGPWWGRSPRSIGVAFAAVLVPILAASCVVRLSLDSYGSSDIRADRRVIAQPYAVDLAGCSGGLHIDPRRTFTCTVGAEDPGDPVYLVGDSNAEHFSDGVVGAGAVLGRPVTMAFAYTCPFIGRGEFRWLARGSSWNDGCADFNRDLLDLLLDAPTGEVLISFSDKYWDAGFYTLNGASTSAAKLSELRDALTATVAELQGAGHTVIVSQSIPRWIGQDALRPCLLLDALDGEAACGQSMEMQSALERQSAARDVIRVVGELTGARVLDLWGALCKDGTCETLDDEGLPMYRNDHHLTARESAALEPEFRRVLG